MTGIKSPPMIGAEPISKTCFCGLLVGLGFYLLMAMAFTGPLLAAESSAAAGAGSQTQVPSVTFTLDFPGSEPDHYSIQVDANGRAAYESTAKLSPDSDDKDAFELNFEVSAAGRKKIFDLAARAHYFQRVLESKHQVAATGQKTLAYKDGDHKTQASYNYSQIPAVQELTTLFQNMSLTLEFGRRLQYDHRYQKLALDAELKRMEEMAKSDNLDELQAVTPILSQIVADTSVINVVRARAQRLLGMAGKPPSR
jgi:hypothetical protein